MLNLFLFLVKTNVSNRFLLCYFDNDYHVLYFLNKLSFFLWWEEQIDKNFLFSSMLHNRILRSEKLTSNEERYPLIKRAKFTSLLIAAAQELIFFQSSLFCGSFFTFGKYQNSITYLCRSNCKDERKCFWTKILSKEWWRW